MSGQASTGFQPLEARDDSDGVPVLHIWACWEFHRRYPGPGDRAACGSEWRKPEPGSAADYTPARGNEHKTCVVCLEVVRVNRMSRPRYFFWRLKRACFDGKEV